MLGVCATREARYVLSLAPLTLHEVRTRLRPKIAALPLLPTGFPDGELAVVLAAAAAPPKDPTTRAKIAELTARLAKLGVPRITRALAGARAVH